MSTLKYNLPSMSGLQSLDDGSGGLLENGVLTCIGVIAEDIQSDNLNVNNSITTGQSVAIGRDVAVGNSVVCPNINTIKLVSNILHCNKIKTEKIHLSNNLQVYDETTVGFIKTSAIKLTHPYGLIDWKRRTAGNLSDVSY
jgi:hypothetical protein